MIHSMTARMVSFEINRKTNILLCSFKFNICSSFFSFNGKVLRFGKDLVKRIFYILHFALPMMMGLLHACTIPVPKNVQNIAQKTCNEYYQESLNITCGDLNGLRDDCSPILSIVLEYVSPNVVKGVKTVVIVFSVIMFTNLLDGLFYWKTFGMIKK